MEMLIISEDGWQIYDHSHFILNSCFQVCSNTKFLLKNFKVYQVSYKCLILKFSKEHQPKLFDKEHIDYTNNSNYTIDTDTHIHIN